MLQNLYSTSLGLVLVGDDVFVIPVFPF